MSSPVLYVQLILSTSVSSSVFPSDYVLACLYAPPPPPLSLSLSTSVSPRLTPFFSYGRYKKMWQWVDNSIAYYTRHLAEGVMHPACGAFPEGNVTLAELGECNRATTAHYLCELPPPSHGHPTEEQTTTSNHLQLSRPANQTFPSIFHATCPKGHVTHNFLACDVTSACWAENYASSSDTWEAAGRDSCDAPLTSLPPSYACGGGRERVPYSLVCDHRDDCPDGSDEQFCVFPQCSGSSQLQCNNQQVRWIG